MHAICVFSLRLARRVLHPVRQGWIFALSWYEVVIAHGPLQLLLLSCSSLLVALTAIGKMYSYEPVPERLRQLKPRNTLSRFSDEE
jgi:hypothetical protein